MSNFQEIKLFPSYDINSSFTKLKHQSKSSHGLDGSPSTLYSLCLYPRPLVPRPPLIPVGSLLAGNSSAAAPAVTLFLIDSFFATGGARISPFGGDCPSHPLIVQALTSGGNGNATGEQADRIGKEKEPSSYFIVTNVSGHLQHDTYRLVPCSFDMQQMSLEELKHVLFHAFRDHLTMKDIENIIVTEEESLKENSGNCHTEFQGVHSKKKNRQTCVRKSLICAFAMAFIISVMLIAANQMLRNGME
ncbi:Calcium-binding protein 8 [Anabarilius grahami]|uniref:Calcium-binding protein 8 n=1 Tax=Anabarilius grahami TaxID=495550 RepID=A0A3N0YN68_ANAGA|nr:Calcium-binding protein 8 [Anabarilius grahami]